MSCEVIFKLTNCVQNTYNAKVTLTPLSIVTGSGYIVMADSITSIADSMGQYTFENVVGNTYKVNVISNRVNNEFYILVPDTSGSYNAADLLTTI